MSARNTLNEIDRIVVGIEVQEAVDAVVAYIRKTQKFESNEAAHGYWTGLSDDEKIDVLSKALTR